MCVCVCYYSTAVQVVQLYIPYSICRHLLMCVCVGVFVCVIVCTCEEEESDTEKCTAVYVRTTCIYSVHTCMYTVQYSCTYSVLCMYSTYMYIHVQCNVHVVTKGQGSNPLYQEIEFFTDRSPPIRLLTW